MAAQPLLLACTMIFLGGAAVAEKVYTQTFRSPSFVLGPGDVSNKYLLVDWPKGHIALRGFNAQVVGEDGIPIPLHEIYLHHWTIHRYYQPRSSSGLRESVMASNSGPCDNGNIAQLFGLGSETRLTETDIPAPYGIEIGDPEKLPVGYDEIWELNVHAIDTRGAKDKQGCAECVCELYNITDPTGRHGFDLPEDYAGGLECCYDKTHCTLKEDFEGSKKTYAVEYYIKWVDMSDEVVPVKVYIFDVTDSRKTVDGKDNCLVEYAVPKCAAGESVCIHLEENVNFLPKGGDVVYAVAHQHTGGLGSTLYNSDGSEICASVPTYGNGSEPGNEVGYIVGMSTCYPQPGTQKLKEGEPLRVKSWYSNEDRHTGVMCLFYILVDESAALPPAQQKGESSWGLMVAALVAAIVLISAIVANHLKTKKSRPEYERLG